MPYHANTSTDVNRERRSKADAVDDDAASQEGFVPSESSAPIRQAPPSLAYYLSIERHQAELAARRCYGWSRLPRWAKGCAVAAVVFLLIWYGGVFLSNGHSFSEPMVAGAMESGVGLCESLPKREAERLNAAVETMRLAGDGPSLASLLVADDVCFDVDDLPDDTLAYFSRAHRGRVVVSFIVFDRDTLLFVTPDELAAIAVHEATHARRRISGSDCYETDSCELMPNGVALNEEVAAHLAEARWWEALHGKSGTWTGASYTGTVFSEQLNELLRYEQQGYWVFKTYVSLLLSDPSERAPLDKPPFLEGDD